MDPVNEMQAAVISYFSGEKRESLLFLMAGGAAIAASVWLWMTGSPQRSMAWPLIAVALIQLVVGWTVYSRTDRQARDLGPEPRKGRRHVAPGFSPGWRA